jgi:hypothetical protein
MIVRASSVLSIGISSIWCSLLFSSLAIVLNIDGCSIEDIGASDEKDVEGDEVVRREEGENGDLAVVNGC